MPSNVKQKIQVKAWLLLLFFCGAMISSTWHDLQVWHSYGNHVEEYAKHRALDGIHPSEALEHHCLLCDFHAVAYDLPPFSDVCLCQPKIEISRLVPACPVCPYLSIISLLPARAPPGLI